MRYDNVPDRKGVLTAVYQMQLRLHGQHPVLVSDPACSTFPNLRSSKPANTLLLERSLREQVVSRVRPCIKTRVRTRQEDPGTLTGADDNLRTVTQPEGPGLHGPLTTVMEAGCGHGQRGPGQDEHLLPSPPRSKPCHAVPCHAQRSHTQPSHALSHGGVRYSSASIEATLKRPY